MKVLVQKYGGSSVGSAERIRAVAERVVRGRDAAEGIVVVVSAMGDTTDELIHLAHSVTAEPDPREMDLLLSTGETVSATLLALVPALQADDASADPARPVVEAFEQTAKRVGVGGRTLVTAISEEGARVLA